MTTHNRGSLVLGITAALASLGEMTAMELADHIGADRYFVHAALSRMRKANSQGGKRVYVVSYVYDHEGARKYPRAVFALGNKPDAKKPKADQLAVKREYYARQKSLATANNVFNLGAHWRA